MDDEDPKTENANEKTMELKSIVINASPAETDEATSSYKKEKEEEAVSKDSPPSTSQASPKCFESKKISPPPTPPRASPEPSCAICLEHLTNKSFTNSCFHMFCFTCLVEWSKVKPECPLCKQSFTSIVHNVKSFQEYDQYHISSSSRTPDPLWHMDRTFRYRTTLTPGRLRFSVPESRMETEMTSHRMRYAPHAVNHLNMFGHTSLARHIPCVYRRRIYEEGLWVQPTTGDRLRCASPEFFRRNIACTHRLLPWLNRELLVVMPHNETMIPFVLELIMALIVKYHIRSPEFYSHIEPYTARNTSHFIHEFYNFAISPYDMENYDFGATYTTTPPESAQVPSSPDNDVVPLASTSSGSLQSTSKSSKSDSRRRKINQSIQKQFSDLRRLQKLILKRNSENNCWENVGHSQANNGSEVSNSNLYDLPGPSTSWDGTLSRVASSNEDSTQEIDVGNEVEFVQDDECLIVDVLKPKSERTPEVVHLSSDDESQTTTSEMTPIFKNNNLCVIDISDGTSCDEDEIVILDEKPRSPDMPKTDTSLVPIDYSFKNVAQAKSKELEDEKKLEPDEPIPSTSGTKEKKIDLLSMVKHRKERKMKKESKHRKNSESRRESDSESKRDSELAKDCELKKDPEPRKILLKSAVRVLSNENDSHSDSWSPLTKPKKRRAMILDDSSTESCSEGAQLTEIDSRKITTLKLRSVVAHFSFDRSDEKNDSIRHSSSHKRHKEKRKKKKHKHRRHIYSSDST